MFKFRQNQTNPVLIRYFCKLDSLLYATKEVMVAHSNWKTWMDVSVKKSRIISWELNIEWEHLFQLFLGDLDKKWPWRATLQKRTKQKQSKTVWRADNLFTVAFIT